MGEKNKNTTLKKLAKWSPTAEDTPPPKPYSMPPPATDPPFTPVQYDRLVQGGVYIIKIKQVTIALFEGWNDDMCCFSILRSEVDPMRWSEARQLPGDFDVFEAFDETGNPPIHLWAHCLRVPLPIRWFSMFEEAKRKQRQWLMYQQEEYHPEHALVPTHSNTDVSTMELAEKSAEEEVEDDIVEESTITASGYDKRQYVTSPSASQIFNPAERILDREQIRRHLVPGHSASILTRSSTTASSQPPA